MQGRPSQPIKLEVPGVDEDSALKEAGPIDRRRFLLGAGAGVAAALAGGAAGVREARAAGEVKPSYRTPGYRDLYYGKWEEMVANASTDSLYGRKI